MSKWIGERLCEFYSRTYSIDAVVLRYFNVYGPREPINGHYAPVVGLFKRQKRLGKKITIVGSGEQRRDFTYIDDVVQANISAINAEKKFTILNVGTGKNYSINELAYMICDDKSQFEYISDRRSELKETLADITKTQKEIGWSPSKALEDMLMSY
jgi:UDP-glucose 4-epimerase